MSVYIHGADLDEILVEEADDGVFVKISSERDGYRSITLPPSERHAAAQALAGDEYRVVPADVRHGCQWTDDPDEPCPVCGTTLPQWERELLARDQAAPPDRPEPVHPSEVKVGDYVEVVQRHDDLQLRVTVEGEVYKLAEGDTRHPFHIRGYGAPAIADMTTVRVLHAADSPQRLFGRLISTAKGREILDANGIHGVERAEKAEAAIGRAMQAYRQHTTSGISALCKCIACGMARGLTYETEADRG